MPSFRDYQKMMCGTTGEHHTSDSMGIIEATWYSDPASKVAYFYDYYRDDQPDKNTGLNPEKSKTKIPVDIKYIISSYNTMGKDEVDLRIMFKPSYKCNIPYYDEMFSDKTGSIFPTGLFCDIKTEHGVWNRWLVVSTANIYNGDFPTWGILPCGYKFQWIFNGRKQEMWGVEKSQNS